MKTGLLIIVKLSDHSQSESFVDSGKGKEFDPARERGPC